VLLATLTGGIHAALQLSSVNDLACKKARQQAAAAAATAVAEGTEAVGRTSHKTLWQA
jgi:hypothetical protein